MQHGHQEDPLGNPAFWSSTSGQLFGSSKGEPPFLLSVIVYFFLFSLWFPLLYLSVSSLFSSILSSLFSSRSPLHCFFILLPSSSFVLSVNCGSWEHSKKEWVKLQGEGMLPSMYCVVDLHALTSQPPKSPERPSIADRSLETAATFLACGINAQRSILFRQSRVIYPPGVNFQLLFTPR